MQDKWTIKPAVRRSGRCMYSVIHKTDDLKQPQPRTPTATQPSAWYAHKGVKPLIYWLWTLPVVCLVWGLCIDAAYGFPQRSWAMIPIDSSVRGDMKLAQISGFAWHAWIVIFLIMVITQGLLTLSLHCSELLANLIRDEVLWRRASTSLGTRKFILDSYCSWPGLVLLLAKPVIRKVSFVVFIRKLMSRPSHRLDVWTLHQHERTSHSAECIQSRIIRHLTHC